jgi:hypothetical protein
VYCDIKSGFSRPLDNVLHIDDEYILSRLPSLHKELPHGELLTHFVIAAPRHPFSAAVIEKIVRNIRGYRPWHAVGRNGVIRTTGPVAYTLAIDPLLDRAGHRFVIEEEIGSYFSIDYDHLSVFPNHFSARTEPVVQMGAIGTAVSGLFTGLRSMAHKYRDAERSRPSSKIPPAGPITDVSLTNPERPSSTLQ